MTNPANSPYVAARQRVFGIVATLSSAQRRALVQELTIEERSATMTTHTETIREHASASASATIDSASDARVVNNVMRHEYRVLDEAEKANMKIIKDKGLEFWQLVGRLGHSRELSLSQTKIEEAVMWAVKHITK